MPDDEFPADDPRRSRLRRSSLANIPEDRWLRALVWLAPLFLAVPTLRMAVIFGSQSSPERSLDWIYDDTYYYLTVARNVVDTGRSTFDGATLTNGYQPLWQLLLVGWTALVGTEPFRLFLATGLLVYGILVATPLGLGIAAAARKLSPEATCLAVGLPLGLVCGNEYAFTGGMETVLFVPLFVPLVLAIERKKLGALSLLFPLAATIRVDALAFLAAFVLVSFLEWWRGGRNEPVALVLRRALRVTWPALLLFAAYFAWNTYVFGVPVPVSGLSKAIDGPRFHNFGIIYDYWLGLRRLLPLVFILGIVEWFARRRGHSVGNWGWRSLAVFVIGGVVQYLYYAAFSTWPVWPWYTYSVSLTGAAVCARLFHVLRVLIVRERLVVLGAVASLVAYGSLFTFGLLFAPLHDPVDLTRGPEGRKVVDARELSFGQVSLMTLHTFFRDDRLVHVAMGDRAGSLAYWGRGRVSVIQTEGLVLGSDYLRARKDKRGEAYLESLPIDYLVVDREFIPTLEETAGKVFIVAEPVQGRVTTEPGPTFCFPESAIAQWLKYSGTSQRVAFSFRGRIPCSRAAQAAIHKLARNPGIRRLSLPSEYETTPALRFFDDLDRRFIHND